MIRYCDCCGRELDHVAMFCDRCGTAQYPILRQLLIGHSKLRLSEIQDRNLPNAESKLQRLVAVCAGLDAVFKSDVNTAAEFDSFIAVRARILALAALEARQWGIRENTLWYLKNRAKRPITLKMYGKVSRKIENITHKQKTERG